MPPVQASAPFPSGDSFVQLFGSYGPTTTTSVDLQIKNNAGFAQWVITGIDFVAWNAQPVQCFFRAEHWNYSATFGAAFYYDSQSTGEGNGIWFSWRGALPLAPTDTLNCVGTSASNITWGGKVFGIIAPYYGMVH